MNEDANFVFTAQLLCSNKLLNSYLFTTIYFVYDLQVFAVSTVAAMTNELNTEGDTIVILKKFDELRNDLPVGDSFDVEEVKNFITGNSIPLVQEFSQVRK